MLKRDNFLPELDDHVVLDEVAHVYTVDGLEVGISTTRVVTDAIGGAPFDADLVVDRNLASWRANKRSKYHHMVVDRTDDEARGAIKRTWVEANELGKALHARLEANLNDDDVPDPRTDAEWDKLQVALAEKQECGWAPLRSELSLFYTNATDKVAVCAGQIDALFNDADGDLVIVDLKRTAHDLQETARPFGGKTCAAKCLAERYANDFTRYSLQTSIYAVMLEQRLGRAVRPENRWLLQAHPELESARWVRCACLDAEARTLLDAL
jgi:hypothetical protein